MHTHGLTRRTRLGRSFLTGVDRRVHAPLGTVIKFSGLLAARGGVSRRRGGRFTSVVSGGAELLLGLIGSILRLSHVRSNGVSFRYRSYDTRRFTRAICRARRMVVLPPIRFVGRFPSRSIAVRVSHVHLARIVAGFLKGTGGFASRKRVGLNCFYSGRGGRVRFFMRSANTKVPGRRLRVVFRQFCGQGRFMRNMKLKLTVDGIVMRGVGKRVSIRSRIGGNDHFATMLPCLWFCSYTNYLNGTGYGAECTDAPTDAIPDVAPVFTYIDGANRSPGSELTVGGRAMGPVPPGERVPIEFARIVPFDDPTGPVFVADRMGGWVPTGLPTDGPTDATRMTVPASGPP